VQPAPAPDWSIDLESPFDARRVEALVDAAFGPGRFGKTAERLREGSRPALSLVARHGRDVVGTVRLWPVRIGGEPALFLGPVAVDEAVRGEGVGAALVEAALERARAGGRTTVLLVGDMPYFGRFGFEVAREVELPGPVDRRRVLIARLDGAEPPKGPVVRG
jgi:predicted N-acetyltransferase YhbS